MPVRQCWLPSWGCHQLQGRRPSAASHLLRHPTGHCSHVNGAPGQKAHRTEGVATESQHVKKADQPAVAISGRDTELGVTVCTFMRRMLDEIPHLRAPWHRVRVTKALRQDIVWWLHFMQPFNGLTPMVDNMPVSPIWTDACPVAAGCVYNGMCLCTPFNTWDNAQHLHMNHKETLALEPAVSHWAPHWSNRRVVLYSDNQAAVGIINKGTCRDPVVMATLVSVVSPCSQLAITSAFKQSTIPDPKTSSSMQCLVYINLVDSNDYKMQCAYIHLQTAFQSMSTQRPELIPERKVMYD